MLCIFRKETNPYFNIAAEEYVLKSFSDDVFMLWRNEESLIVGKHQNPFIEIDSSVFFQDQIPVIRRISGGGTVYHDPGNINFTFVFNGEPGKLVDYPRFLNPVITALNDFGIKASIGERNEIMADGLKISGNAQHVYKNRVLHHGTILFSANLDRLNGLLRQTDEIKSKALRSVPGKVTNLASYLAKSMDVEEFQVKLYKTISNQFQNSDDYFFSKNDVIKINKLVNEKYSGWEWNYGYSPDYHLVISLIANHQSFKVNLVIQQGLISNIQFDDRSINGEINHFLNNLKGIRYLPKYLLQHFNLQNASEYFDVSDNNSLVRLFFMSN